MMYDGTNGNSDVRADAAADVTTDLARGVPDTGTDGSLPDVRTVAAEIDLSSSNSILSFGYAAQEQSVKLSESLLAGVMNKDVGPIRESLNDIVLKIRGLDVEQLTEKAPGFFGLMFGKVAPIVRFTQQYEDVTAQIDVVAAGIQKHVRTLMSDVENLDRMYEEARRELKLLEVYIAAGKDVLEETRSVVIPRLKATAEASGDFLDAQVVSERIGKADELERRVHDLIQSRQLVIQDLVELRSIQTVDASLVSKARSVSTTTIGLWKKQIYKAVAATRTLEAAEAVSSVGRLTNELIVGTSQRVREASMFARQQIEASMTDIATITAANENLIIMIDESIAIADEGRRTRLEAEAQMAVLETRTKDKLRQITRAAPHGGDVA